MRFRLNNIESIIILGCISVSIFVTPVTSFDAFNPSRFVALGILSLYLCAHLVLNSDFYKPTDVTRKSSLVIILISVFWMIIATALSNQPYVEKLYGVSGRNTGVLTYTFLFVFMAATILIRKQDFLKTLTLSLVSTGTLCGLYGLLQSFGKDPFEWINPHSPVFSFFGNPNFHSAFMGMTGASALSLMFWTKKISYRIFLAFYQILIIFNIFESKSQQGIALYMLSLSIFILYFARSKNIYLTMVFLSGILIAIFFVILDVLRIGVWQPVLYEESISYRGDFWRSGWKMALDNPAFGVGMDGYRDNYRIYRDLNAVSRNVEATVDSPHNLFLDFLTGGGFPLLLCFALLTLLILVKLSLNLRKNLQFDPIFAGVAGAWIAFLAQSFISVTHLGLAIWGWVLGGALLGSNATNQLRKEKTEKKVKGNVALNFLAVAAGCLITIPLFVSDVQFRNAIDKREVTAIEEAVKVWPQSPVRMNIAAAILREGGFSENSLQISKLAMMIFPENAEVWDESLLNEKLSPEERVKIIKKLRQLDPLNPKYSQL